MTSSYKSWLDKIFYHCKSHHLHQGYIQHDICIQMSQQYCCKFESILRFLYCTHLCLKIEIIKLYSNLRASSIVFIALIYIWNDREVRLCKFITKINHKQIIIWQKLLLPLHVKPFASRSKPARHLHSNEPTLLWQRWEHPPLFLSHSFTSGMIYDYYNYFVQ